MALNLNSFISFASTAGAKSTVGLLEGGDTSALVLRRTSAFNRAVAAIKTTLIGISASERRAVQAFSEAIRRDYGSTGVDVLNALGVREGRPLRARQVQQIAQSLSMNRASEDLREVRELNAFRMPSQQGNAYDHSKVSGLYRSTLFAMAENSTRAETLAIRSDRLTNVTPQQSKLIDLALAVSTQNVDAMWQVEGLRDEYTQRLDLSAMDDHGHFSIKDGTSTPAELASAAVLNELISDKLDVLEKAIRASH